MANQESPLLVPNLSGVTKVVVGDSGSDAITCVLLKDATLECFGSNHFGLLGTGMTDNMDHPTPTKVLSDVVDVSISRAEGKTICAVKKDGSLLCWGDNGSGQLGIGKNDGDMHPTPTAVPGLSDIKAVSLGANATCAVKGDGSVWCFGSDVNGELAIDPNTLADCHVGGDPSGEVFKCQPTPKQVVGVTGAAKVAMGQQTGHILKADGTVVSWGENGYGALGNGKEQDGPQGPTEIPGFTATTIAAWGLTYDTACAIGKDGAVYCWGTNYLAALAEDPKDFDHETSPKKVMGLPGSAIAIDQNGAAGAIMQDGTLWHWGSDGNVGVPDVAKFDGLN
jgi:alpha-tubulin suppressor-like RCC1 family protein